MKDLHSHILYNMDDGAKSVEESIEIFKLAYKNGVTDIVLTPHYIKDTIYNKKNEEKYKNFCELKKKLEENNIDINIYLGNEVYIDEDIMLLYKKGDISTINNSRYMLIEFPLNTKYIFIENVLEELISKKMVPIIAHPERYILYYKDFTFFENLLKKGCLLQGNIGSLYGKYGLKSKIMLKSMLKKGMIQFLASDIHHKENCIYEKNIKKDLLKIVKDKWQVDCLLEYNADKVINDEKI